MTPIPVITDPTAADWLSAWSTLFAAVGTVGAFALGLGLWCRERRSQARHVHGYAEPQGRSYPPPEEWSFQVPPSPFVIENKSDGPIYSVHLPRAGGAVIQLSPVILAGGRRERSIEEPGEIEKLGLADGSIPVITISFSFTDQTGIRWTRRHDGRLEETSDAP
ncbi:hypothetical protein ACEZDB_12410 [Streptacidiphilus sp. N1-3]|uniref:Uncharacterized protein n=1 Tax=Streptacidiphilus alkalitolerans TaxID=3342712 RepID=A0ABV6WZH0_9ACTN